MRTWLLIFATCHRRKVELSLGGGYAQMEQWCWPDEGGVWDQSQVIVEGFNLLRNAANEAMNGPG